MPAAPCRSRAFPERAPEFRGEFDALPIAYLPFACWRPLPTVRARHRSGQDGPRGGAWARTRRSRDRPAPGGHGLVCGLVCGGYVRGALYIQILMVGHRFEATLALAFF